MHTDQKLTNEDWLNHKPFCLFMSLSEFIGVHRWFPALPAPPKGLAIGRLLGIWKVIHQGTAFVTTDEHR